MTPSPPAKETTKLAGRLPESPRVASSRQPSKSRPRPASRRRWLIGLSLAVGLALIGCGGYVLVGGSIDKDSTLVYYQATRGPLEITVVERGNLESQENIDVLCEVDDIRGDNIEGTPIVWLVENGSSVREGDLLCELDSASHIERLDEQIIQVDRARAEQISTRAAYEDQQSQNKKALADADLQIKLAELDLKMFTDPKNGTHKLEVEEIKRELDDINNQILESQASLELKRNDKEGIEALFKLGYAGKSEVERARLDFLQAESAYAANMNRLDTQLATLNKKNTYEREKQLLTLEGELETAKRVLEQVKVNNAAELAQKEAAMEAAERALAKEVELLERYESQLEKCKIYAPQDGMVAYAVPQHYRQTAIAQGSPVRERQLIMNLPNLSKMEVKTKVHESVLDQIRAGLPATVRIDAFPDRSYRGSVKSVAVLPDQGGWMSSDTKVYETVVRIDEDVQQLKPGMTAVVEIHVDHLSDVISVPVQAIMQVKRDTWCYVDTNGKLERHPVELGKSNTKFVEVVSGVHEGDSVILNPTAIVGSDKSPAADDAPSPQVENGDDETDSGETPDDLTPAADPAAAESQGDDGEPAAARNRPERPREMRASQAGPPRGDRGSRPRSGG
ncbi:MAG: efflux RND transporter periplasmic adaptor subunit [Planctomycetales bacterium]|nr:efflux RND transporter periplasmic adaptor subunit [Planctomycetales bacterium]